MEQKNKFIYILPVMFGFFIMGFCDLVGISVTYAKEQFQWTETQAGFLPSMVFLCHGHTHRENSSFIF